MPQDLIIQWTLILPESMRHTQKSRYKGFIFQTIRLEWATRILVNALVDLCCLFYDSNPVDQKSKRSLLCQVLCNIRFLLRLHHRGSARHTNMMLEPTAPVYQKSEVSGLFTLCSRVFLLNVLSLSLSTSPLSVMSFSDLDSIINWWLLMGCCWHRPRYFSLKWRHCSKFGYL
jgi:hypothetical protein